MAGITINDIFSPSSKSFTELKDTDLNAHKYLIIAVMLAGCCCGVSPARALAESEDVINYAYSSWIGSGFYKIGDRTVYLLRGPFSYTLREANSEKWGLELLLPATIGFHDNADENLGTVTFVPGL